MIKNSKFCAVKKNMSKYDLLLPPGIDRLNIPSSSTAGPEGISIPGERNSVGDIEIMDFTEAKTSSNSNFFY